MCIQLIYYFVPCGHVESEGWSCRNKIYNFFCDSPFVEQEAVRGESCTRCGLKARRRHAVLKEIQQHTVVELVDDEETNDEDQGAARALMGITTEKEGEESDEAAAAQLLVELKGKAGEQGNIKDGFKVTRSKSGGEK